VVVCLFINSLCDTYKSSLQDQWLNVLILPIQHWKKRNSYKIITTLNNQCWFYKKYILFFSSWIAGLFEHAPKIQVCQITEIFFII